MKKLMLLLGFMMILLVALASAEVVSRTLTSDGSQGIPFKGVNLETGVVADDGSGDIDLIFAGVQDTAVYNTLFTRGTTSAFCDNCAFQGCAETRAITGAGQTFAVLLTGGGTPCVEVTVDSFTAGVGGLPPPEVGSVTLSFNATNLAVCTPNWSCDGFASCDVDDEQDCNSVVDLNACGDSYSGDYTEFTPLVCDYCTPDVVNDTWSAWSDVGVCLVNDTQEQTRSTSDYDANDCYAITGLPSDEHIMNFYSDTQYVVCDYCSPNWSCSDYEACVYPESSVACSFVNDSNSCFDSTGLSSDAYSGDYGEFTEFECIYDGQVVNVAGGSYVRPRIDLLTGAVVAEPSVDEGVVFTNNLWSRFIDWLKSIFGGE